MLNPPAASDRLRCLDSIRGIAALVVVFHHARLLYPETPDFPLSAALHSLSGMLAYLAHKIQESGRTSVVVFFVLSGFVLSLSLRNHTAQYRAFLIKRFFRIYPAFLFAIAASLLLHMTLGDAAGNRESHWAHRISNPDYSPLIVLQHLLMWGTSKTMQLDGVMWSLVHEVRISLIFPLLLALMLKHPLKTLAGAWAASLLAAYALFAVAPNPFIGLSEGAFSDSLLASVHFIVFFTFGIAVALRMDRLRGLRRPAKILLALAVAASFLKVGFTSSPAENPWLSVMADYLHGLATAGLIVLMIASRVARRLFEIAPLIWLGRISYSLYLLHTVVIYAVYQLAPAALPPALMTLLIAAATLLAAELAARYIEYPFIALGKRIAGAKRA